MHIYNCQSTISSVAFLHKISKGYMKKFILIFLAFSQLTLAQEIQCKLDQYRKVEFKKLETHVGQMIKFQDDTIYFYRQNNDEHVFLKPNGDPIILPGNDLGRSPTMLKNGNLLFANLTGGFFEFNSNGEVVNIHELNIKGYIPGIMEWDQNNWFISTGNGEVFSKNKENTEANLIFNINANNPSSDPDDWDGFFRGAINYQNKFLIINPGYYRGISFLDLDGKLVFEVKKNNHNPFQDPIILKDGSVVTLGRYAGVAHARIIDPNNNFKEKHINFKGEISPYFMLKLDNENSLVGNISLNEDRTAYNQTLNFYDSNWNKITEIVNANTGYNLEWNAHQLSDGYIVNGVKDTVQLISPDYKIIDSFKLPFNGQVPNQKYQAVTSTPVVLSNGGIVYLGEYSEVFYFKKVCK
jgi:hypothetical protein